MTITPDSKNWTWVLEKRCEDCGLDTSTVDPQSIAAILRDLADKLAATLGDAQAARVRPAPDVWSPLEYSCHVRDVYRIFEARLKRMLTEDAPLFANWDQDQTAIDERYGEQDPAKVAAELPVAADAMASALEAVRDDEWSRTGDRSDGARFTVASFARYLLHDPVHHLWDVTGQRYDAAG